LGLDEELDMEVAPTLSFGLCRGSRPATVMASRSSDGVVDLEERRLPIALVPEYIGTRRDVRRVEGMMNVGSRASNSSLLMRRCAVEEGGSTIFGWAPPIQARSNQ
jgi:hypothetical protein